MSTNLSGILATYQFSRQGLRGLPYDHFSLVKKTSFVQSEVANDDFSLVKFHRSRSWLAATKNRTIFSSLSSLWINLSGRDPFNQNFRKFRSKTQWIGSVKPEKFRKNWSTFWGGPLFPVGPVGILVEWIAPSTYEISVCSSQFWLLSLTLWEPTIS